jgi:hypothetical protein
MTKLVFGNIPAGRFFNAGADGTTTITHKIDVTDTIFKYQLIQLDSDGNPVVVYNTSLNIAEILNHPRFSEQSFWRCWDNALSSELVALTSSKLTNLGSISILDKSPICSTDGNYVIGSLCPWVVFVPHKNAKFSECIIRLSKPEEETNIRNGITGIMYLPNTAAKGSLYQ